MVFIFFVKLTRCQSGGSSWLKRHCNCENLKVIALERSGRADDLGQQKQNKLVKLMGKKPKL